MTRVPDVAEFPDGAVRLPPYELQEARSVTAIASRTGISMYCNFFIYAQSYAIFQFLRNIFSESYPDSERASARKIQSEESMPQN